MLYKVRNKLKDKDIVINIQETYPDYLIDIKNQKEYNEDKFYEYIYQNKHSYILLHRTRLTDFEIKDVKTNGMLLGGKDVLIKKINNLPACCDDIKPELFSHVYNLHETRADEAIYSYFGNLNLANDDENDKVFWDYWGGESIYTYYTDESTPQKKTIRERLQCQSKPCVIILRYPADIEAYLEQKNLYYRFMNDNISNIVGSIWVERIAPEVIDVVDLSEYSGLDFS